MRKAKFIFFLLISFCLFQPLMAQTKNKNYLEYIEKYSQLAVIQQNEHGIPASIILAQGLLESGAGNSTLAKKANNHFGIKCHNTWAGDKVYHDDDEKGECFRKYNRVIDSYEDHSAFLTSRGRYSFLFELSPTDYKGWAHGLKKAGYATDPTYAYKLISLIENYELHQYDLLSQNQSGKKSSAKKSSDTESATKKPGIFKRIFSRKTKDSVVQEAKESSDYVYTPSSMGTISAFQKHNVYRNNGIRYVVALEGDTWASIADEFNMSENKLRKINETSPTTVLVYGSQVYLQTKARQADKRFETHVVRDGESMYSIAQRYAVQIEWLYKLNEMNFEQGAKVGQVLKLR